MVSHACHGWQLYITHLLCLFFFKFVLLYDLIRDVSDVYADVFWALQWCHEVKVGYINFHKPGSFCRYDAVEEDLCDENI